MVAGSGHWCTSVMSESLFTELWPGRSLEPTTVRLVGCCNVDVSHESQSAENLLLIIIVAGSGPCRLEGLAEPCQVRLEKDLRYAREYCTVRGPGGCLPGRFGYC